MTLTRVPKIHLFALVMLITGSIDSVRNLPASALFGSELIFFFLLGALIFLIPVALVSAELSSTFAAAEGGIYGWVRLAFGDSVAFLAIWLQWINTMVWYPTILSFIAATAAFLVNPALASNKWYLLSVILVTFWSLTFLNMKGLRTSANFASFCAITGMLIPMGLIVSLAIAWLFSGNPLQIKMDFAHLMPHLHESKSWISLTAIMTSYLGMELASVHVNEVEHPRRTFPIAMLISVLLIMSTMVLGSLAIAFVLPHDKINLVEGVMQTFQYFLETYHLAELLPVIAVMLLIGSLGGMVNWIISPAKGLLLAAHHGFLPHGLTKENEQAVPGRILVLQAVLVTIFTSLFFLVPSVNTAYWLLTDLSTELYMLMYVLMFLAALRLRYKFADIERPFAIPGGSLGIWLISGLGLIGCAITITVGFLAPDNLPMNHGWSYGIVFAIGMAALLLPTIGFIAYRRTHIEETRILTFGP